LAVHLGLDEKIGIREVQKINTYCLPVPGAPFEEVMNVAPLTKEQKIALPSLFKLGL